MFALVVEELGEFLAAFAQAKRGRFPGGSISERLCDELADALIVLKQVQLMYDISDDMLDERVMYKLNRLAVRIQARRDKRDGLMRCRCGDPQFSLSTDAVTGAEDAAPTCLCCGGVE